MDYTLLGDEELQSLASGGDRSAEAALVDRYLRLARACARPYFLIGGDGDDLIQEGTIGLLDAVRNYDSSRSAAFRTYAEVCIRNRILNAIKAASRQKHAPLNDYVPFESSGFDENQAQAFDTARDPEELFIEQERLQEILSDVQGILSPLERKVMRFYLDGLSCDEIGSALGRSRKSVENAVARMRRKLSQTYLFPAISAKG